ncbi:MAG TPA: hypothetical protein VKW06_02655 [Candidatus Angelobacter sp.]|nr:hypothetical protein [Candidatus Angelobacter sp.]
MPSVALFGISVVFGFVVWGTLARYYIWPALRDRPGPEALRPILLLHAFRFMGLSFLVPGVVSPDIPAAFARSAGYGDFIAAILALLALAALGTRLGTVLAWVFSLIGTGDLLLAFYLGPHTSLDPGQLGPGFFIVTVFVPFLFITHIMAMRILVRTQPVAVLAATR